MVDERDRARARLGLPPLATTSAAAPVNVVDEQTKARAMRTPTPTREASPASFRKFEETGVSLETPTPTVTTVTETPPVTTVTQNPPSPTWVKASTVITANGPVDVDANGLAADGSRPVAVVTDTKPTGIPAGFTPGPFPKELEQFFGSSEGILGYRIETLTDKDGRTYNQLSVATGPGSSKTFGAGFTQRPDGKYALFSPGGGGSGSGSVTGVTGTKLKTAEEIAADEARARAQGERQSAYDLLLQQFNQYGLGALVEPLKGLITSGASPAEFTIRLRESDAYKKRFAANAQRIQKGLTAISEAEYLGLEDQYQNIMRNYGLPESYYTRGDMGVQEGFNQFIANDVSAAELEDRVMTAQSRVMNANPEVLQSLRKFYPGITNGDILAYTLDPQKALTDIKRKVTAAEIGGAATQAGLGITGTRAEELGAAGITKQQAQQGFQTVAEVAPRGGQLAEIYKQSPYTQTTAEAEVFGLGGSAEAARQRKKLTSLETAAFQGSAGAGAIARDRAGVL
jgi:hypothetical protein